MTTTVSVSVNGNYQAECRAIRADGTECGEPVTVGHGETKTLPHYHGEEMTYRIVETPVGANDGS